MPSDAPSSEKDIIVTAKTRCGLCGDEREGRTRMGLLQESYLCTSVSRSGERCPGTAWVVDRRVGAWVKGELRIS